jgi:hypothetical protein
MASARLSADDREVMIPRVIVDTKHGSRRRRHACDGTAQLMPV